MGVPVGTRIIGIPDYQIEKEVKALYRLKRKKKR